MVQNYNFRLKNEAKLSDFYSKNADFLFYYIICARNFVNLRGFMRNMRNARNVHASNGNQSALKLQKLEYLHIHSMAEDIQDAHWDRSNVYKEIPNVFNDISNASKVSINVHKDISNSERKIFFSVKDNF